MSRQDPEEIKVLRRAGNIATVEGIRGVTEIMKRLVKDPWVQMECTRLVWNFIFHYPKFKKVFFISVMLLGGYIVSRAYIF